MLRIWKIKLGYTLGNYKVKIPCGGEVLKIGVDPSEKGLIVIWVKFNPRYKESFETKEFTLVYTGQDYEPKEDMHYLDSVDDGEGIIYHVFEHRSGEARC